MKTAEKRRVLPLTPYQALALGKAKKAIADRRRDEAEACVDKAIDFAVHVHGHLSVGEDTTLSTAKALDPWVLIESLMRLGGFNLRNAVRQAFAGKTPGYDEMKKTVEADYAELGLRVTTPKRGSVTGKIAFDKVSIV